MSSRRNRFAGKEPSSDESRSVGADRLIGELQRLLGESRVIHSGVEKSLYSRDASPIRGAAVVAACLPESTDEVASIVRLANAADISVVARGSGTGLAGGAVPTRPSVVVSTTRMNRILDVDVGNRVVWVQPGVINLDLTRALRPLGFHFAPDPSSQQVCTVGGNVATNSGGPHCLAYGVTSAHVLALEVVLADGAVVELGGLESEPSGYDLRGALVGSEGTLGIVTRIAVKMTPDPHSVETILFGFSTVSDAADTVSAVIAAGIIPAALEMMDARITEAAEAFVGAGYPLDAAAVLLVELDGSPGGVQESLVEVKDLARTRGATSIRVAADDIERALLWKGRKSAFGAVARIKPNYYLHDTVVPRSSLVSVLEEVYAIADRYELLVMNVFHAGDGNLHPLLVFDGREPGVLDRVHAAGAEIVSASLAAGGVLTGEHGVGLEKREFMSLQYSAVDLDQQARLQDAFDPEGRFNPDHVLPSGSRCSDIADLPPGVWV